MKDNATLQYQITMEVGVVQKRGKTHILITIY